MTPDQYQRAQALFDAVEALPRELQPGRLAELCPDDPELHGVVLDLLAADPQRVPLLHARIRAALLTQADDRVGPYRLVRMLGEGGMGEVWLAEQLEPIRRHVALKLVRAGMGSRRILVRFEAERQALGLMDHPAIAHIFDAGVTDQGLPFFAMEYVDGLPITTFCDDRHLPLDDRLRLFLRVCEGVQHAHQKAVLHRDLKPSNVLVRMQDDRPAPTIIDFGIAKALHEPLIQRPMQTEFGVFVGTPEYMSPERLGTAEAATDIRADVYALGMILYELLVGALPFDAASLRTGSHEHMRQHVASGSLTRPSSLLRRSDAMTDVAIKRATDPARLASRLQGDLDWIVMKSIAPEVDRRYASVAHLALDIERCLEHKPVTARPPSPAYVLSRFVARHRIGVAMTAALSAMLLAGIAGTAIGLVRARKAEAVAQNDARLAEQSLGFLLNLFRSAQPFAGGSTSLTARQMLDAGVRHLAEGGDLDPAARARLRQAIAYSYLAASDFVAAEKLLDEALDEQRAVLGPEHPQTLRSVQYLAELHWALGSLDEAEQLARTAALGFRSRLGASDRATMEADAVLLNVLIRRGHTDEALGIAEDLLVRRSAVLGPLDVDTADSLSTVASLKLVKGDVDEAERLNKVALAIRRAKLGPDHVTTMLSELALADVAVARGNPAAAESICRRAVALIEQRWGPATKPAYRVRERLARVLYEEHKWLEARTELETALAGYRRLIHPGHPDILNVAHLLGLTQLALGDPGAAEALLQEACDGRRAALGAEHAQTVESCTALAGSRTAVAALTPAAN